jgi:hypothetical protein
LITYRIRKPWSGRHIREIARGVFEMGNRPNTSDIPMAVALTAQQRPRMLENGRIRPKADDPEVQARIDALEAAVAQHPIQPRRVIPAHLDSRVIENDYSGTGDVPNEDLQLYHHYTSKAAYIEFVETQKMKWPKDKLVTLRMYPYVPGQLTPPPYYIVHDFQEMRHYVQWDRTYKQPKIIGLKPGDKEGIYNFQCPSAIRELNDQERFLVNVQNQKAQIAATSTIVEEGNGDERPDRAG